MVQQIRRHGSDDHMPSGSDALPWLGDYPFPGGATANQGIHMAGAAANRPTASLGTQTGADGAVSGTAFTAASGHFISADTGDTLQIVDTGAATPVVYSFTVTYVSATALTLSSSWVGVGTSSLSWALMGPGPSNAGLLYAATDTDVLYLGTGSSWLEIADFGGGGGSGLQFNSGTYGPDNVGDWSLIETTGQASQGFSEPAASLDAATLFGLAVNNALGMLITGATDTFANNGNGILSVEDYKSSGDNGACALFITSADLTTGGTQQVYGINLFSTSKSSQSNTGVSIFSEMLGGSGSAYGLSVGAAISGGTGKAYSIYSSGGYVTIIGLPTSAAGLPSGTLWNNSGVVNVA